ncbi:YafY family transcriptional regulator (plasmid) [Rhizobium ruizarguesonis]|uniref:YafY family transcriptional regulator n=1 Tax=Rhizobium ruizarguesonis TaxID=2081791 RepID=A0ABY1WVN3_9HYPH|nr:YafY family protein [Rhizobium ruizarguesonis]TAU17058.1 YafY family transcriptional regulator [Rhizobium ruizarguesonis]TAU56932.1 YafY family transcriptional regulator [Rhizobium ruizarguesonis]TAU71538.1 YafY family transcriptional regulator [Rhizobium ruizarguesonis]TAV01662.1 YafY family transcriptional regulator [Rhizobium ruizarguesonis]TAV21770.1 YafY family transcriptional regulator [Rhizobium ruizarguesonis]
MSKSNRLFDLMQTLRRHSGPVAGSELAREAGVSLRTIYRDIANLQAMGADIEGEPGFGYVLKPGFLLPPLMFSQEELQALTLGAQWVGRQTDDGLAFAAQNAIAKIGAVLPSELRHMLTDNAFHVGRAVPAPVSVDLQVLRQAMREQFKLHIAYRDPKGDETQRIIWPIMLGFIDTRRFVAGWCELRQDFRTFRIDRIGRVELIEERYPGRRRDLAKRWRTLADVERAKAAASSGAAAGS